MTSVIEYDVNVNSGRLRNGNINNFQGTYSPTTEYQVGDVAIDDGNLYLSISGTCGNPNIGNDTSNSTFWIPYRNTSYINSGTNLTAPLISPIASTSPQQASIGYTMVDGTIIVGTAGVENISTFQFTTVLSDRLDNTVVNGAFDLAFSNNFMAVTNIITNNLHIYNTDSSGTLSEIPASPFSTGTLPLAVAYSPSSTHIGTANFSSNNISFWESDDNTGVLTELSNSPISTAAGPSNIAFSSLGSIAAVVNNDTISVYEISGNSVSSVGTHSKESGGGGLDISEEVDNRVFLAASNTSPASISIFEMNSGGSLTEVSGSPFSTLSNASQLKFSPITTGNLFLAVICDNVVAVYKVETTNGSLSSVPGSPFSAGLQPVDLTFISTDSKLYCLVLNQLSSNIYIFDVDTDTGTFTFLDKILLKISGFNTFTSWGWTTTGSEFSTNQSGKFKLDYTVTGTNSDPGNHIISYVQSGDSVIPGSNIGITGVESFSLRNSFVVDYTSGSELSLILQTDNNGVTLTSSSGNSSTISITNI